MALFKKGKQEALFGKKVPAYKKDQQQNKPKKAKVKIAALIIIVVAAIALYTLLVLRVSQTTINSPTTVNITRSGNLYSINSNQYFISLSQISISGAKAYIRISRLPMFINPVLNVSLTLGNITKINVGTNYSNIGIQLQSISANAVTVQISPLFPSLEIAPDSSKIVLIQTNLLNGSGSSIGTATSGSSGSGSGTNTNTSTATTTAGSTTVGTTVATTTIQQVNVSASDLATALKQSPIYALMLNFSVLYDNTSNCTPVKYNNSYVELYGGLPAIGNDYYNVTRYVPYNLSSTTTNIGKGNFNVVYKTKTIDPGFNNAIALTLKVNASTESVTNSTFSGVFMDLNYTVLKSSYSKAQSIGGACGISIP